MEETKATKTFKWIYQFLFVDQSTQLVSAYKAWVNAGYVMLTYGFLANIHSVEFFIAYATTITGGHIGSKLINLRSQNNEDTPDK
jgi:hypothetical protein